MILDFRASVYELGQQCGECEHIQGTGSVLQRFIHKREPVGVSLASAIQTYEDEGGVYQFVLDYMIPGLNRLKAAYRAAYHDEHACPFARLIVDSI